MSEQRAADELGADVWRGARWGVLGATGAARIARESDDPVTLANARNALNHAWTLVLVVVSIAVLVPMVSQLVAGPEAWSLSWVIVCFGIVGLGGSSLLHSARGVAAAERGEVYRAPQTVPFVRA